MHTPSIPRPLTVLMLVVGCGLAAVSAVVPHYDAGYRLMVTVLLAGLLPYLIFILALPYLNGWALALPALLMVAIHATVVVVERFVDYRGYGDGMIYSVPLLLALVAAATVAWSLHRRPTGSP